MLLGQTRYGLEPKEKEQLELKKRLYSSFGRDSRDYAHLYIYQSPNPELPDEDVLVDDLIIPSSELYFKDERTLDLDVGSHLRALGYEEGVFKVKYLFLRRLAGRDETVFVNEQGQIFASGKIQTKIVNNETRYFTTGKQELEELYPKELKYVLKKISKDRTEVAVDYQSILNKIYRDNFLEINNIINYTPTTFPKDNQTGNIRFDKTDKNVLIANLHEHDRGFVDSMVGGEIVIKNAMKILVTEAQDEAEKIEVPPIDELDVPFVQDSIAGVAPDLNDQVYDEMYESQLEDNYGLSFMDDYGNACFVGDTKVKLSNGKQVPIRLIKPGMKVKTQQGYAKVLKVTKDDRPYGDKLIKFGKLITTPHHPIQHKGKWYMANELGREFISKPLAVWNLQLDKHHTIYANNVVSATLNKWKSDSNKHWSDKFYESRNRFKMLRPAYIDFPTSSQRTADSGDDIDYAMNISSNNFTNNNEVVVRSYVPAVTKDAVIRSIKAKPELIEEVEAAMDEPLEFINIDFVATITEILDNNKVRINTTLFEQQEINGALTEFDDEGSIEAGSSGFEEFMVQFTKAKVERLNTYMISPGGKYNLITNIQDIITPKGGIENVPNYPTDRFFKLYNKLDTDIEEMDLVYFAEEKMEPYEDIVTLVPFESEEEEVLFLRLPDFNSTNNPINFRSTQFNSFTDLIGSDSTVQQDIQDKVISGSLLDVQVNVDYSKRTDSIDPSVSDYGFGNFVQFGSAEKRIKNFKKKLELIQTYTSESLALNDVTGSSKSRSLIDDRKRRVINSFDPYENYLYTESGSYVSSSVGEFYNATWPKENSSSPYTLVHTSGSDAISWFNTWTGYAKEYDRLNRERLQNNLPLHVTADTENNFFLDFMDMIGQQFDEIYVYLRHFTDINERVSKLSEGISKDIVREVAKSAGIDVVNGNDLLILPKYKLGKNNDGTSSHETPQEKVTEEIWKRILANTPYFLKTKGTKRAITGLLNCYGIPSSILRVREYGGPDKGTAVNYEIKRKFTYALDFKSSEYLRLPWKQVSSKVPETVEFRFRSPKSKDQTIVQSGDKWAIQLQDNGATDDYGYLRFAVSASTGVQYITSSLHPFYNDDMWSVMLTRVSSSGLDLSNDTITQDITYELTTRQYDSTREVVLFSSSESIDIDGDSAAGAAFNAAYSSSEDFYIGGDGTNFGTQFSGSLMEFRLWSEPLSQSVFENHVRTPKAYNGNTTASFNDNLLFRLPLDINIDFSTNASASLNRAYLTTYHTSASAHNFSGNNFRSLVDLEQLRIPNLGPNRRNATKIRIEDTSLVGSLSSNVKREQSSQDFAPVDSNKLGVYFSPTDIVNEDIAYSIADFNFDDQVGDPRDQYKTSYRGLSYSQDNYWKKYSKTNNFWDYLRIINFYDSGLWTQLSKMVPARANATLGVLIEPNALERSKEIIGQPPEFDNVYFENAGHFDFGIQLSSRETSSLGHPPFSFNGEYKLFGQDNATYPTNGVLNVHNNESGSLGTLGLPTLVKINEIDPRTEYVTTYATASITIGDIETTFEETLQPFISQSRLSEHNEDKLLFFSSSLSASLGKSYSASFAPSEHQSLAYDSKLFRLFYKGQLLTKDNTIDGKEPVEIIITTPTKLVTTEQGDSKLKTDV